MKPRTSPLPMKQLVPARPHLFWIGLVLVLCGVAVALTSLTRGVQQIDQELLSEAVASRSGFTNTLLVALSNIFKPSHTLVFSAIVGAVIAWWYKRWQIVCFMVGSVLWAAVIGYCIKYGLQRHRPSANLFLTAADGYSMPSGHTLEISAFMFALVYLIWRASLQNRVLPYVIAVAAVLLVILVAFSRIYTANHWTSDTVAGAFLGLGAGMMSIIIFVILPSAFPQRLLSVFKRNS